MTTFAFIDTKLDGSESYDEETFPLRPEALAHASNRLLDAAEVSVGAVGHGRVDWIGAWSNTPLSASQEAAERLQLPMQFSRPILKGTFRTRGLVANRPLWAGDGCMNRRLKIAGAAALATMIAATTAGHANASDYWLLTENKTGSTHADVLADLSTLRHVNKLISIWETTIYYPDDPNYIAGQRYYVINTLYNCSDRTYQFGSFVIYNADGTNSSFGRGDPKDWNDVVPNSVAEWSFNFACSLPKNRKKYGQDLKTWPLSQLLGMVSNYAPPSQPRTDQ